MSNLYQQYQHDINRETGMNAKKVIQYAGIFAYEALKSMIGAIKYMISMFMGKY